MAKNRRSRNKEIAAPQRVALGRVRWPARAVSVRRQPRPDAPLVQHLVNDLGSALPVTEAELDAIEQLLGADLRAFLGARH